MEPLERMIQDAITDGAQTDRGCVLIIGPDDASRGVIIDAIQSMGHVCLTTDSVEEARDIVDLHDAIDVMCINGTKAPRKALSLIREAQSMRSWIKAIVWSETLDPMLTVESIRQGASDFIVLPNDMDRLEGRMDEILHRVRAARDSEKRMNNLLDTCKQLSDSRDEMSEQVDVLCGDLASAYRSMRDQMSDAVMVSEFKTLVSQELDVEDMLRTALEYMLRQMGPTNAVVYLPESPGRFGIGAYVNYDMVDSDPMPLYRALGETICATLSQRDDLMRYDDAETWATSHGLDGRLLKDCQVIAFPCRFNGETLAIMTFFRKNDTPFEDECASTLDSLRQVLGAQLGRIVRIHRRGQVEWPQESGGETGFDIEPGQQDTDETDGSEWGDLAA
jgi:DNA-binding response OmpR family regulator